MSLGRLTLRRLSLLLITGTAILILPAPVAGDNRAAPAAVTSFQTGDVAADVQKLVEADWIDTDRRFGVKDSAAPTAAKAVTTAEDAAGGCDGVKNGLWGFHVASGETDPWWQVDLGKEYRLDRVVVYNRCDSREGRTANLQILVTSEECVAEKGQFTPVYQHDGKPYGGVVGAPLEVRFADREVKARVVRLRIPGRCSFALDEVEVYAADNPAVNVALNKPANQISVSAYSRAGTMSDAEFLRLGYKPLATRGTAPVAEAGSGFSLAHTQTVIEQARQLAARLKQKADPQQLQPLAAELEQIAGRVADLSEGGRSAGDSAPRIVPPGLPRQTADRVLQSAAGGDGPVAVPQAARFRRRLPHVRSVLRLQCQARRGTVRAGKPVWRPAAADQSAGELGRRKRPAQRPEAGRRQLPVAGSLLGREDHPVCLQPGGGVGKEPRQGDLRVDAGVLVPHLPCQCRWHGPGPADRRRRRRFRSVLPAQRPDRVHLRTPRRLPALRPPLPRVHDVLDAAGRQRHDLPQLSTRRTNGIPV